MPASLEALLSRSDWCALPLPAVLKRLLFWQSVGRTLTEYSLSWITNSSRSSVVRVGVSPNQLDFVFTGDDAKPFTELRCGSSRSVHAVIFSIAQLPRSTVYHYRVESDGIAGLLEPGRFSISLQTEQVRRCGSARWRRLRPRRAASRCSATLGSRTTTPCTSRCWRWASRTRSPHWCAKCCAVGSNSFRQETLLTTWMMVRLRCTVALCFTVLARSFRS